MAPEVVQHGNYDARADVWSLGITAVEMAQTHPPLWDMSPALKVMFHIASKPAPSFESPAAFSVGLQVRTHEDLAHALRPHLPSSLPFLLPWTTDSDAYTYAKTWHGLAAEPTSTATPARTPTRHRHRPMTIMTQTLPSPPSRLHAFWRAPHLHCTLIRILVCRLSWRPLLSRKQPVGPPPPSYSPILSSPGMQ